MKHITTMNNSNTMNHATGMRHNIAMKSRQALLCALTLLLSWAGTMPVFSRVFEKGERIYINGTPDNFPTWKNDNPELWCKLVDGGTTYWIKVLSEWWYTGTVYYIVIPEGAARNWNYIKLGRYASGANPAYAGEDDKKWNLTGEIWIDGEKNYIQNFAYGDGWRDAYWSVIAPAPSGNPAEWSLVAEDEQICTSAAGTNYTLAPKNYDYDNSKCHAWFTYNNSTRNWDRFPGEGNLEFRNSEGYQDETAVLGEAYSDTYYFYQANKPSQCRLLRVRLNQDCSEGASGACKITNFAAVASDANVTDKISAVDGQVAFDDKKNAGNLMIWCDNVDTVIIPNNEIAIPQTFKLRGFDASEEKTYTLHAKFLDDASGTCVSTCNVTVAPPSTTIITHDENENSIGDKSLVRFTEENITLYPNNQTSTGFMWINSENENRITEIRNHTFTSSYGAIINYTFIATNDPVVEEPNLISVGGSFESNSGFHSNYANWNELFDNNDSINFYDTHGGYSGGYAICKNSTWFSNRYNKVLPHEGDYFGLFDSKVYDGTDQDAWRVEGLSVQSGTSYLFSFWVANINNFGEMNNGAQLQFQISYDDGVNYVDLGDEIDLSDYRDNRWHGLSSIVTPPVTVNDRVRIRVINKNQSTINRGNDFGLDDIRFEAITTRSSNVAAYEVFPVTFLQCKIDTAIFNQRQGACGATSADVDFTVKYKNPRGDLYIYEGATKLAQIANSAFTDPGTYSGTIAGRPLDGNVHEYTIYFKDALVQTDAPTVYKDTAHKTPAISIVSTEWIAPACGSTTCTLRAVISYTNQNGTLSANVDGGTPVTPSYIVENDTAKTITIDIPGVVADGKTGHKLNISFSGSHGCSIANHNILTSAPKGNTISAFAVEAIEPACDGTTYQLRATWTVAKAAVEGSVYDRLIIADKDGETFTTLKTITITASNATDGTVVLDEMYAVATLSHPTIVAYLEERGKTCYTAAADYYHPVVPAMSIGTPTFENISCNKSTFDMVVPVTYTNQHGKMWAWIDSRTKMEVTIDTNCKTGGEYKGYKADETTERTTYIVFTDLELSGDHTVSVECDGTGSCHRTNAVLPDASRSFTAPLLPKAEVVTPISFPSVAACDQATFDLTLSIKFTYQDGYLQAWADGNSPATFYTPSESAGEGKYIKRSTGQTKSITLTGLPADGGTAHTLYYKFNAEGFCGYSTPLEFDLPDFPQSPTVTSTTVTSVPSRVACDASSHTATVNVVFKNGKGKKIVVENEDGTVIHTSTDAMASDNDTYSTSVSLSDIDGDSHYVRAYFLGYGSCKTTDAHKGTYTAPVQASISDVTVASVSETNCNTTNYTITGTVTFANAVSGKKLIVWYDGSHKQEISSPVSPQAFSIKNMNATGATLTVKAYFEDDPSACHVTSNTFAAPTVPTMTIKNVHQSTPGCDDLTYNLDFDVDYVYQHGDLTVHVGSYGDTVVSIPVANRAQTSKLTAHVTYSGKIPADGSAQTLYASFGGANSCSDTKTLVAMLSPVITDMSVSVPTTPIACDATSYPASVTVNTQYAKGKKIVIVYKNKADEDVELGTHVVASSPESYPFTGLSFTDIGASGTRSVRAYLEERDGCIKSKNYSIPPTTSIDSPFDVDIVDKSTCSGVKYDLSGSITYSSKPAGVDPAVRFGAYDATMTNITASGADFAFTNVTTVGTDMHVEAYFENKPLCSVSSATFSSPLKPDFEVLSQSMATPDCDVTTTTLTFDIRYTKQPSGTLTVWVDDTEIGKHTVDYTPNASSETPITIENVTVAGIPADGNTHTLHVKFDNGCGERTYTTPATQFSPAISEQAVVISNESCNADTYTATVTFTVANGQGKNVTVSGKGSKTITKAAVDGTNTFVFSGANAIARTLATTTDDYFEIFFPDASASCPHKTAAYTEKPKPQLVEIEFGADPVVDCFDDSYTLTGKLYYTNINAAPRVWLDDVASDAAKTTLTYVAGQSDTKNTAFSLTIPADGRSHVIYADVVGWDAACAIEENYTAIWSPVVTSVTPTLSKSYVHCNETYSVTLSISYARGLSGKKIYASCSDHGETISGNAALVTGSSTASITLTGLKETDHTDHPLSLYFEGLASCPITSFDYDEPHVKAITLDAITSNDVNCGDPSFSITGKVAANVAGEKIIISDGFGHMAEVTPAVANTKYSYTITGLTAEGSVKAQFEGVACSETAAQPFANVTLKPIPTVSITSIGNECDYIDETTVHYTTTDASTYKYYILGKTPLSSAQTAETSGSFTLDISMLTAGTYALKMVANNATCKSDTTTQTFTVYPKPTIAIGALSEPCDDATSMTIPYTSTDAATYRYYIVGKTPLSSAQTAAESSSFTLDISALDAGTYTLKMVANSANCVSDTATKTITIHPLPTFTLSTAEADSCYPTPEIVVSYTSTNASKYSYTLTKSGALSPSLNVSDQTASASGTITMNTTGLASGTYTLSVTAVSDKGCNIATPATKTIEILKQPTVSLTDIDDICEKTASVATTLTLTDASKYDYTVIKEGSATPVDSKINQTATTLTLTTSTWTKGTYTLQVTAISSAGCSSVTKEKVFRIYPQPKVADLTNATICEKDVTVSFTYTMTDAKTYTYVLKNSSNVAVLTQSTPQTVAAGGTGTITFNPSALRDGTYTLYVTATSDNDCVSDAKSSTLTIKNKPSLTISDIAPQCYPIASFTITYTPKDVKYVKWTVDSKITDEQTCTVPNTAPYEFAINTSEWAAGTYTLRAYPVSALDCDSAAVVKTFTIHPQPAVNTLADATICEGTASATFAYTMSSTASTYSYELKNSSNETVASKTNEPASTSGSIIITTSSLADGTYTLHVTAKSANGCESADKTSTLTINNKPEVSLGTIAAQCYPATSFTIGYTPTDAAKLRYSVDGKVDATEISSSAELTINTSDWAAGDYTLRVTPISSHGCEGTEVTGTIKINAKPTATIATVANKCDNETSTLVEYTTTNAATYKYYIDGVTSLSDPETASTSGSFSLDISGLNAGDYTLKLIAYSEAGCASAEASKDFTIYPLPTLTLSAATLDECYPISSISVPYTSTNASTYSYTLKNSSDATVDSKSNQPAAATGGSIALSTAGLPYGTYTLSVTAKSTNGCDIASAAIKQIKILRQPSITLNAIANICYGTESVNATYTMDGATTYNYAVKRGTTPIVSKTGETAASISLTTTAWEAGDYTLTMTAVSDEGCTNTDSKTFTIHPQPAVNTLADATICEGTASATFAYTMSSTASTYSYELKNSSNETVASKSNETASTSGSIAITTSSLADGTYTLHVTAKSVNGCESADKTSTLTINNKPEVSLGTIAAQCYPASSFTIGYTPTDAVKLRYSVDGKVDATEISSSAELTINTSDWAAGDYTLRVTPISSHGCEGTEVTGTIKINAKPTATIATVANKCDNETSTLVEYTTTNAATYKYYIDGVTSLSDPETASTSGSFSLDISGLNAGDYTLKLIAYSEAGCESAVASKDFTIYPLPTLTLSATEARDCHPSTSISVGYTSTNAKTYNYTLTLAGESTPALSVTNQDASISGTIVLNTTGLAAGTYTLAVQVVSEHSCTMAAEATKIVTIQAKPTVTINSVENHCKANAAINVSYSTTDATTYHYEVLGTDLKGHADAAGTGSFTIDISTLAADTYTLRMKATSGTCESVVDEETFTIYPIPAVTFDTPAPIRSDATSVDVTLHLSDATHYDYDFDYSPVTHQQSDDVSASQTTVTINTVGLGEGNYTLYVTPKNTTTGCVGETRSVTIVINNKPSINFNEPAAVCAGSTGINIAYGKSDDAEKLTYSITKGGTPVVTSAERDLTSTSSPLSIDISGWSYGTYTLTGKVSYEALDHSIVEGDESSVNFTILADLSVASVSQPVTYIGCGDSYSATIVVNLLNAAGRTIHAKYVDDNTEYTPSRSTSVGDATVTFVLSGLKDTGRSSHSVSIYVDGYESCCITATYAEPTLKTLTLGAPTLDDVNCGDDSFSISGTLSSNFAGGAVIISDGNGHFTNVTSAVGDVPYTITGLTASGTITAKFVGYDCSETAPQSYTVTALRPIPTLTLTAIAAQCYPTESFVVAYNHTDATDIKYAVKQGETEKQAETTVTVNAEKEFTVNTSGWEAGTYTIDAYAVSAGNCTSSHSQQNFTIHPKPTASITSMESKCIGSATATLAFTTTNATQYQYCIEGKTGWSAKAAIAASYDVPVASLPIGDYKIRLVAHSATCVSDTADAFFHIYPLPTFTLASAVAEDCHPSTSISVDYTSTDAKTYSYTLTLSGESTPALSVANQDALASGTIVMNTTGLAAGTYTLAVQATSEHACTMAAEVTKTVTIHPKPTASITSMESKCIGSAIATLAFTTSNATEYQYCIEGQTSWSSKAAIVASYDVPVASLPVGDYKIRLVAHSATCISDTADATFHIYPLPTFTLASAVAEDCYPSTSISVGYTSTDAKTYSYTLTLAGESTPALSVTNQDASASGTIVLNTTGLAAGTYTLAVQATSEHACIMAAEVTKTVTIHPKPTVMINSVTSPCKDEGIISVNYSSTYASEYTYAIVGTTLAGNGTAAPTETFTIDISSLTPGLYTLQMTSASAQCASITAERSFTIYPVPAVTLDPPAPIRDDVTSVDVTIHLSDATNYDFRFIDKDGSTVLDSKTGISAANTTVTLNTTGLGEGEYTLYVTPKSATCVGQENSVTVVINNKPSIVFTEPAAVCAGTASLNIEYTTSTDAKQFTYAITTKAGTPKQATTTVNLSDYPSSQTIDISTWEYGTYTLTGHVSYSVGGITVTGDESSVDFTILADLSVESVSQPLTLIGCKETYSTTVVVNLFNNAGRTIHAKCTDDTNHEVSASAVTTAGDPTATLVLTGLKDVNHTAHPISIYVDGYESCGITDTYDEPTLMLITPNFTAEPQRKDCNEAVFTIQGKVFANCNTGNIVVEYDDIFKATVPASTFGSDYVISNIPTGGSITQLNAYFDGKTCGIVNSAVFAELPMPEASVVSVNPVAPPCDTATFTLYYDISYTYQPGDLTVWLDSLTADKALYKKTIATTQLSSSFVAMNDSLVGLPADGSTSHVLHYQFAGEHACGGAQVGTFAFPKTPLIKDVSVVKDVEYIEGLTGEYYPTVTVTYEKAYGQIIELEYFDKDNNPKYAESSIIDSDTEGSYIFDKTTVTGWSFDDVTMGNRVVHAYFKGLACTSGGKHDGLYIAPTNCSIKFESIDSPTNKSTCDNLLYDLTGKVSFVGAALGDLIVELTIDGTTYSGKIDSAQCIAGMQLPFVIENINKSIPDEGLQLTAYFFNLPGNATISADKVYTPAIPHIDITGAHYTVPACNETTDSLVFVLHYTKQQGNLHVAVNGVQKDTIMDRALELNYDRDTLVQITIPNLKAHGAVDTLHVWFDGANSCDKQYILPATPFSPRITNVKVDTITDVTCGNDSVTLVVSYRVENGQNAIATIESKDIRVTRSVTDGIYTDTLRNVPRTYLDKTDDTVMVSIPATYCTAAQMVTFNQVPRPELLGITIVESQTSCGSQTYPLQGSVRFINESGVPQLWLDDDELQAVALTGTTTHQGDTTTVVFYSGIDVPADGYMHTLHLKADGTTAQCPISTTFRALQQPLITSDIVITQPTAYISCGETYSASVSMSVMHADGKKLYVAYQDSTIDRLDSTTVAAGATQALIPLTGLHDVSGSKSLTIYFEDELYTCSTAKSFVMPELNKIEPFDVITSANPCGTVDYTLSGTVKFNNAVGLGNLIVKFDDKHADTISIANPTDTTADFRIEHMDREGREMQLTAYFAGWPDCVVASNMFDSPKVPELSADITAIDTVFTCSDKRYDVTIAITAANQTGSYTVTDSVAGGSVRTMTDTKSFSIALPNSNETHYVIVRYPATGCEFLIPATILATPYVKPEPKIRLTPIARLCNSETEINIPLVIEQGDIHKDSVTLTLLDSKGNDLPTGDLLLSDNRDTLSFTLLSTPAAGTYTAIVEVKDTLGCADYATLLIEFAQEGVLYSKWTDVLLVDNAEGLYTGYQWYENGVALDGKTEQTLYMPDGMNGTYTCRLTTEEGMIFTCEYAFSDIPRSADNPPSSPNHITVLPNRVHMGGSVTVQQSELESLHLVLLSATGQRVAELTQTESKQLVDMPSVQGVYMLRIESSSGVQAVKIVVY